MNTERNNEEVVNHVHHGARKINNNSICYLIPGIKEIDQKISHFRHVAYYENNRYKTNVNHTKINKLAPEKFNNNISILGERGMGKSSNMITLINEVMEGTFFNEDKKKNIKSNDIDIITRIIDPDDIGENASIIGWIITALAEYIQQEKNNKKDTSTFRYCEVYEENEKQLINLNNLYKILIQCYSSNSDEGYPNLLAKKSITIDDFVEKSKDLLSKDFELHQKFNEFVNELICYKRKKNKVFHPGLPEKDCEPLIFFFFDDVDMSARKSPQILKELLSFLSHPNIVTVISGDYNIFTESLTNYFLESMHNFSSDSSSSFIFDYKDSFLPGLDVKYRKGKDDEYNEIKEIEYREAVGRCEFFLKKVMPPQYRYHVRSYSNELKFEICYDVDSNNIFEKLNIYQLISYDFGIGFSKENRPGDYLEMFIVPRYNENNENSDYTTDNDDNIYKKDSNSKTNYVFAYLSVFGKNVRGFMNVYNYLCSEAQKIQSGNIHNIEDYWSNEKFTEFINILLDSKYTYYRYKNEIRSFLSMKDYNKKNDDTNLEKEFNATKLRIDCEELERIIRKIIIKHDNKMINNEDFKNDIKSLILLPIFLNELFYNIHGNLYYQRYKRIQEKLKNILCNIFINSINHSNVCLLPAHLDLRRTLVYFHRLITRMSIESLENIGKINDIGNNAAIRYPDDKKYIVQLIYATILISEESDIRFNYDQYEKSTYIKSNRDRKKIETDVFKQMNHIFSHLDRDWLQDKIKYASLLDYSVVSISNTVINSYLKDYQLFMTTSMKRNLEECYNLLYSPLPEEEDIYFKYGHQFLFKQLLNVIRKNKIVAKTIRNINKWNEKTLENHSSGKNLDDSSEEFFLEKLNKNTVQRNQPLQDYYGIRIEKIMRMLKKLTSLLCNGENMNIEKNNCFYEQLKNELSKRIYNTVYEEYCEKTNQIKSIFNCLYDFKTEYEIIIKQYNTFYENYLSEYSEELLDEIIYFFEEEGYFLNPVNIQYIIRDNIFDIYNSAKNDLDNNLIDSEIKESIRKIVIEIRSIIYDEQDIAMLEYYETNRSKLLNNILEFVKIKMIKNNNANFEIQYKTLRDNIGNYLQCYYMFVYLIEFVKIQESVDAQFYRNFKENIQYDQH